MSTMKRIKNLVLATSPLLMMGILSSCDKNETSNNIVTDEEIITNLTNYPLEYQYNIPGNEISLNTMWDGYGEENGCGISFSKDHRIYTYLLDFSGNDTNYYFVYIKEGKITGLTPWVDDYLKNKSESNECKFLNGEKVVDGKYLLSARENDVNDFLVTCSNSIDQKYEVNGYRMTLCLKEKKVTISENVSSKKSINKTISLYTRVVLNYDSNKNSFEPVQMTDADSNYRKNLFSFGRKMLATYPNEIESKACLYDAVMGFNEKKIHKAAKAEVTDKGVLLPRIEFGYDLLDDQVELPSDITDAYGSHKKEFLDAFKEYESEEESQNRYAYFDTEKVMKIIS